MHHVRDGLALQMRLYPFGTKDFPIWLVRALVANQHAHRLV